MSLSQGSMIAILLFIIIWASTKYYGNMFIVRIRRRRRRMEMRPIRIMGNYNEKFNNRFCEGEK